MKYYTLPKIIVLALFMVLSIQNVSALTLDSASANPYRAFACQPITIYGNFSGPIPDSVYANIDIEQTIYEHGVLITQSHNVTLANSGGIWSGTWGNDQNIHWGRRGITYNTYEGGVLTQFSATNVVFIMNSDCTGTGKTNYSLNPPPGIGNYTKKLYQGMPFLDWAVYPWLAQWGYLFYVFMMFTICLSIYMKTENIGSPLLAALLMLLIVATTGVIPLEYRNTVVMIIGVALGAIYMKFFVKRE